MKAIRSALEQGFDFNRPDKNGWSSAFHAAWCPDPRALELLIDAGLDPVKPRADGYTLLHRAATFGRVAVIRLLLKAGIPFDVKTASGKTPLDSARIMKHGKPALKLLTRLTQKAKQKAGSRGSAPKGDVTLIDVKKAIAVLAPKLKGKFFRYVKRRDLETFAEAFFSGADKPTTKRFLTEMAKQDDPGLIAAAVFIAHRATKISPRKLKLTKKARTIVHVGDLEIDGDFSAGILVVTGNLVVSGKLSNYEGAVVAVGGNLIAQSVWTEGPMLVAGDLHAKQYVYGYYNDYPLRVGGSLKTSLLIQEQHAVEASRFCVKNRYNTRNDVPEATLRAAGFKSSTRR